MKALLWFALVLSGATLLADPPVRGHARQQSTASDQPEKAVLITGSLIPKRVKVRPIGTTTVSPLRVIDRSEIDQTGHPTTPAALINEPAVNIIGR